MLYSFLPDEVVPQPAITAAWLAYVLNEPQDAGAGRVASLTFVIGDDSFNKAISLSCQMIDEILLCINSFLSIDHSTHESRHI